MKTFALAAIAAAASAAALTDLDYIYMRYITEFSKQYETVEEFNYRHALFAKTHSWIDEENAKQASYTVGHNFMSDFTQEEKNARLGMLNEDKLESNHQICSWTESSGAIDWRAEGAVTPVKDQGQCGSCWAFSTIEVLESKYILEGNPETIMAPQQLVDCNKSLLTNHGCNGGLYYKAYDWLATNKSMLEADYPYTSGTTGKATECASDASKGVTNVSSYCQVDQNVASIKAALAVAPVNIAVSAASNQFMYYTGGILMQDSGCSTQLDHAIAAVGWGSENGVDYYIVRNSWGSGWGESGFIRMEASDVNDGTCGMNQDVYAIISL